MEIIPGIHFASFKWRYKGRWADSFPALVELAARCSKRYGYGRIGLELPHFPGFDVFPDTGGAVLEHARRATAERGVVPMLNIGSLALNPSDQWMAGAVRSFAARLETACGIGARHAVFGCMPHGRMDAERTRRAFRDAMVLLDAYAAKLDVICMTWNSRFFGRGALMHALQGLSHIKFLNDTGNWLILGENPVQATAKMLPVTACLHLKDYVLFDGVWHSVPLGQGRVNNAAVMDVIRKTEFPRDLMVLIGTDMDSPEEQRPFEESFAYYNALWRRG